MSDKTLEEIKEEKAEEFVSSYNSCGANDIRFCSLCKDSLDIYSAGFDAGVEAERSRRKLSEDLREIADELINMSEKDFIYEMREQEGTQIFNIMQEIRGKGADDDK